MPTGNCRIYYGWPGEEKEKKRKELLQRIQEQLEFDIESLSFELVDLQEGTNPHGNKSNDEALLQYLLCESEALFNLTEKHPEWFV